MFNSLYWKVQLVSCFWSWATIGRGFCGWTLGTVCLGLDFVEFFSGPNAPCPCGLPSQFGPYRLLFFFMTSPAKHHAIGELTASPQSARGDVVKFDLVTAAKVNVATLTFTEALRTHPRFVFGSLGELLAFAHGSTSDGMPGSCGSVGFASIVGASSASFSGFSAGLITFGSLRSSIYRASSRS